MESLIFKFDCTFVGVEGDGGWINEGRHVFRPAFGEQEKRALKVFCNDRLDCVLSSVELGDKLFYAKLCYKRLFLLWLRNEHPLAFLFTEIVV